jgi:YggT family protein
MATYLVALINLVVYVLSLLLFLDALVSFVLNPWHPARRFLDRLAEPFVRPFRSLLPPMGGLDFSVMAALIAVQVIGQLLVLVVGQVFH